MFNLLMTIADAAPAAPGRGGNMQTMIIYFGFLFAIFYFMILRPQQRKEKERRAMISELKTGTKVIFGGGIKGVISNVKDDAFVIRVGDNIKMEVLKDAVSRVVEKNEKATENRS